MDFSPSLPEVLHEGADDDLDQWCESDQNSGILSFSDDSCRNYGHSQSVWFWMSSVPDPKDLPAKYCFLTYSQSDCEGGCPIKGLNVNYFMKQEALQWEKEASQAGKDWLWKEGKKRYGRCMHQLKKEWDEKEKQYTRSYKVVPVSDSRSLICLRLGVLTDSSLGPARPEIRDYPLRQSPILTDLGRRHVRSTLQRNSTARDAPGTRRQ